MSSFASSDGSRISRMVGAKPWRVHYAIFVNKTAWNEEIWSRGGGKAPCPLDLPLVSNDSLLVLRPKLQNSRSVKTLLHFQSIIKWYRVSSEICSDLVRASAAPGNKIVHYLHKITLWPCFHSFYLVYIYCSMEQWSCVLCQTLDTYAQHNLYISFCLPEPAGICKIALHFRQKVNPLQ